MKHLLVQGPPRFPEERLVEGAVTFHSCQSEGCPQDRLSLNEPNLLRKRLQREEEDGRAGKTSAETQHLFTSGLFGRYDRSHLDHG